MYCTYEDIHKHVEGQSVLVSSLAKPCSDFLTVLLDKPHDLFHVFSDVSHLVLLFLGTLMANYKQLAVGYIYHQHRRNDSYVGFDTVVAADVWMVLTKVSVELQLSEVSEQLNSSALHHVLTEVHHAV